ncbi:MAG: hypothetical protein LBT13_06480 [Treponema sp.]|jgi:hypothetical protein|nr:hypothetical protein [Treponema sp.]
MQKSIGVLLFLWCLGFLWAEEPRRYVEFGVDAGGGFGNNYIGFNDIFNYRKTIYIDLNKVPLNDITLMGNVQADTFMNINFGERFTFGIFAGVEALFYSSLPKSLFQLLIQGNANKHLFEGNIAVGASVFTDVGIKTAVQLGRLRVTFKPSMYVPLLYMPVSDSSYIFNTQNGITLGGTVALDMYTVISLENGLSIAGDDLMEILKGDAKGFDFSLAGEYGLLPILDVGMVISHIPLIPALLHHEMRMELSYTFAVDNLYDTLIDGDFALNDPVSDSTYRDDASFRVFRPLRFDCYALFKPVGTSLFVLKPNIGLSFLTIYGNTPCFNVGLEGQMNIMRFFSVALGTGYTERLWKHRLALGLNLRVVELDAEVSLQAPQLTSSFNLEGLGVSVGLRFGF